jgi:glycosyltransferase involved in cell wall biosynthesis
MKILFISGREPTYVRNAMILKGLERKGVGVVRCSDSSSSYAIRFMSNIINFLLNRNDCDVVFVGFFGQPLVPFIRLFTTKPIILDAFLSAYDTMCFDRKTFRPNSLAGRFFFWLDKYSCRSSYKILLDTNAHIDYFVNTFDLRRDKFQKLLVGADESLFYPREIIKEENKFKVFYFATYHPLHGTEYIIQAAKKLERNREIEFKLIGKGPQSKQIRTLARSMGLQNVRFVDWVPYENLPFEIAKADICLGGHFSDIEKARRVIAGKTYQFIAMKKPVIVGDCPGNRELFTNKQNALFVKMADADALANAVLELKYDDNLREKIAEEGYRTFVEYGNTEAIGRELKKIFEEL